MASTGKGALLTDQHRRRQVSLAITADSQARRAWDATLDLNDLTGTQPIWKRTMLNLIQTWWRISEQAALAYLPQYREAETGEGPGEDHHGLGAGHAEESLSHGVADAADQHGLAAGDVVVELAPEGGKEEVCGLHSRQRHTEHIIVQIIFLDEGGGHWVGEAGRHEKGGEHHKKQEHMVGSGFLLHAVLPFPQ